MKAAIIFILLIPSISLADLWKCGKVYSTVASNSSCVLVKKASTKCLDGGFRKISALKNEESSINEECPKGNAKKKPAIKTRYLSEKFSISKSENSYQEEKEELSEVQKMGKLAVSDPISFSNKLQQLDEGDEQMFTAAGGNGMKMNEAQSDFNAFKRGEVPEDYR